MTCCALPAHGMRSTAGCISGSVSELQTIVLMSLGEAVGIANVCSAALMGHGCLEACRTGIGLWRVCESFTGSNSRSAACMYQL